MISDILALIEAHTEAVSGPDMIATARDAYRALQRLEVELGGDPNESVERAQARIESVYVARGALVSEAHEILETITWRGALACLVDSSGKRAAAPKNHEAKPLARKAKRPPLKKPARKKPARKKPARKKPARKKASRR